MKISNKIMILFSVLTFSIILLMSFFVYYLANRYSFGDFYKRLEIRAYLTANAAYPPNGTDTSAYNLIRDRHLEKLPAEEEYIIPSTMPPGASCGRPNRTCHTPFTTKWCARARTPIATTNGFSPASSSRMAAAGASW